MNAKLASKDIRQLGLHHLSQQVFESDSDDEDFDDNSAANQESEDRDYQGGGDDEASETSEEMKELVPESDMEVEEASDHEESNPSVSSGRKESGSRNVRKRRNNRYVLFSLFDSRSIMENEITYCVNESPYDRKEEFKWPVSRIPQE